MARTYREMAIENMVRTVEEAMSRVFDSWGDLPPPMKEAIKKFRTQLNAAIDSVEFVKRLLEDVAPNSYSIGIGVWGLILPSWAVMAAVRRAEPSVERSAVDRRSAA
jgi:hypothetical protein